MKFVVPTRNPNVIYTDNCLEFGKACEDLSWNHCTSTPHRSETKGIAERAVRRVKEGTSAVLLQSGLGNEGWADSMECYCYLRNIQDLFLLGRHPMRGGSEYHSTDQLSRLEQWSNITLFLRKTSLDCIRLEQQVLPGMFFGSALNATGIWKGDIMVADIEELEETDASEHHARRLNAKDVVTPQRSGNFTFPVADGTVKIFGGGQHLRTSTNPGSSGTTRTTRHSSRKIRWITFSSSTSRRFNPGWWGSWKWLLDDHRRIHISSSRCTKSHDLHVPKEESFPVPLKYIDVTRENYRRSLERGWRKRIIRCMDGLHKIYFTERKATRRIHMARVEIYEETNYISSRQWMARYVETFVWCSEKESKTKMAVEKGKLDNVRQLRGIFFLEPNDEEFKLTVKAARRVLEAPMPAAMPLQNTDEEQWRNPLRHWETKDNIRLCCWCRRKHETKARRSWTQTSSRAHYCRRDEFYASITVLFANSFRCLKHWKFQMQRQ